MVRRHRWLESRENKNFAIRSDLENRSAAITDVQVTDGIKRNARRDAHSLDPLHRFAAWGYAMNRPVVAGRNEKKSLAIDREARRIHQLGEKGFDRLPRRHLVERHRNFLATLPAERDVNISVSVDRRI